MHLAETKNTHQTGPHHHPGEVALPFQRRPRNEEAGSVGCGEVGAAIPATWQWGSAPCQCGEFRFRHAHQLPLGEDHGPPSDS